MENNRENLVRCLEIAQGNQFLEAWQEKLVDGVLEGKSAKEMGEHKYLEKIYRVKSCLYAYENPRDFGNRYFVEGVV